MGYRVSGYGRTYPTVQQIQGVPYRTYRTFTVKWLEEGKSKTGMYRVQQVGDENKNNCSMAGKQSENYNISCSFFQKRKKDLKMSKCKTLGHITND